MPYSRPWTTNRCRCVPVQPNAICNTACRPAIVVSAGSSSRRQISGLTACTTTRSLYMLGRGAGCMVSGMAPILASRCGRMAPGRAPPTVCPALLHNPVHDRRNRQRPFLQRSGLGYKHPACWKWTPTTLPQYRGHLVQQPGNPVLLDISDGDPVDTRCAAVAAHVLPRPLQDISAIDLVPERVEPSPGIGLGRPVQRMLQGPNRIHHGPRSGGTSRNGTHRAPPRQAQRTDEAAALPSPAVVLSARLQQYYGRLRRPPDAEPTSRRQPVIEPASPAARLPLLPPSRASPVPVATI